MGSLAPEYDASESEVNVLVTGFGPFGDNRINPSFLIASSLPKSYETPNLPKINIHAHPSAVTVSYRNVRELIPKLLFSKDASKTLSPDIETIYHPTNGMYVATKLSKELSNYDIVLNIGMAPGRHFYAMEICAHRDGYNKKDVDGKTLEADTFWQKEYNAPEMLRPSIDTEDVWRRWKAGLMDEDLRPSNDAGHYLCDFTYYTSMVEYWRRDPKGERPCMFLHVPGGWNEENIERGRGVALELIKALVGSEMAKKRKEGGVDGFADGKL